MKRKYSVLFILILLFETLLTTLLAQKNIPQNTPQGWTVTSKDMNTAPKFYENLRATPKEIFFVEKNNLWGAVNGESGLEIISPKYNSIELFNNKTILVSQNDLSGIIDFSGKQIIQPLYNSLVIYKNDSSLIIAQKENKFGLIDFSGKTVVDFVYSTVPIQLSDNTLKIAKIKNNSYQLGVVNNLFKEIIPFSFMEINLFQNNYIKSQDFKGNYFLYDLSGKLLLKSEKDIKFVPNENTIINETDIKTDLEDKKTVITRLVTEEYITNDKGRKTKKYSVIDLKSKKLLSPYIYDDIILFNKTNYMAIRKGKTYQIYSDKFMPVSQATYSKIDYNDEKKTGMQIIRNFYNYYASPYIKVEEVDTVENKAVKKIGLLDCFGNPVIPVSQKSIRLIDLQADNSQKRKLLSCTDFNTGNTALYEENGKIVVPYIYTKIYEYVGYGMIGVHGVELIDDERRDLMGLIDTLGHEIIKPSFDKLISVSNHSIIVEKNGRIGLYNINGQELLPIEYNNIEMINDSISIVTKLYKKGLFNIKGTWLTAIDYDDIDKQLFYDGSIAKTTNNKKINYISLKNKK